MKKLLIAMTVLATGCNKAVDMEQQVDDLYERMTQEERIAQLIGGAAGEQWRAAAEGSEERAAHRTQCQFHLGDVRRLYLSCHVVLLEEGGLPVGAAAHREAFKSLSASSISPRHSNSLADASIR